MHRDVYWILLTLTIGSFIENTMPGMGAWFFMVGGFFLGVSEVMYWISKALQIGPRST